MCGEEPNFGNIVVVVVTGGRIQCTEPSFFASGLRAACYDFKGWPAQLDAPASYITPATANHAEDLLEATNLASEYIISDLLITNKTPFLYIIYLHI